MKITDPNYAIFTSENARPTAPRAGVRFTRLGLSAALSLTLLIGSQKIGLAAAGDLDPTFGIGGKVTTSFGNLGGGAHGAALQSDGKIVAVGFQAQDFALARYLSQ
jgi:Domain of unknown function (DUF5122) beta-propeller